MKTIVIFEDNFDTGESLRKKMAKALGKGAKAILFQGDEDNDEDLFEKKLLIDLKQPRFGTIGLIIADRDLSGTSYYDGLSEAAVSEVANQLGIPICLYAKGIDSTIPRQSNWTEGRIILQFDDDMTRKAKIIFEGFESVRKSFSRLSARQKTQSPAKTLSFILGKPEISDRISIYGAGNRQALGELMPYYKIKGRGNVGELTKRTPRFLGYLLLGSVIRFPGILVNATAAASHLNIDPGDFTDSRVQFLFRAAKYKGPFSGIEPLWWRHVLDELVEEARCESGLDLVRRKVSTRIKSCKCSVNPSLDAGFYCMIREKPVSAKHSTGNISWFPAGADLARISKPDFDELAPWLNLA